jgi:polyisoprenoid-binding protein YceI
MSFKAVLAASVLTLTNSAIVAEKYRIDPEHVSLNLTMQHMKWAKYQGTIRSIVGEILFDKETVSSSSVHVEMETASIDTLNIPRDIELRGIVGFNHPKFTYDCEDAPSNDPLIGSPKPLASIE